MIFKTTDPVWHCALFMNPLKLLGDKIIWYDNFQNNWSIKKLFRKFSMPMCKTDTTICKVVIQYISLQKDPT